MKYKVKKASLIILLMPFFFSCRTYRNAVDLYYNHMQAGRYKEAGQDLNKIKLLKKKRNKLLFNLEAGTVQYKLDNYQKSNEYLNAANEFLESSFKSVKDVAVSNLVNPMMETYRGEPFEPFMVNYYKAINYLNLGLTEDAVVEARKITLASDRLAEKYKSNTKRYNKDPFALTIQGVIYEASGDINNAFIAYRNAANIFLDNNESYYGLGMPLQLKKDLLRTAYMMGFTSETERFEKLFGMVYDQKSENKNEMILFIEEGSVPVKEEYVYTIIKGVQGRGYQFVDQYGQTVSLPFNANSYGVNESKLTDFSMTRIALPVYRQVYNNRSSISISINGLQYQPEKIQSLSDLAPAILRERLLEDLAKAFARHLIKASLQNAVEKKTENKNEQQQSKKNDNSLATLFSIASAFSEKADTRSWLSLPAYIHYVRIPLTEGENTINVNFGNKSQTITVKASRGVQVKSISLK